MTTLLQDKDGREVASTARIFVGPSTTVKLTDRVTMPDGSYRDVLDLILRYDLRGTLTHKEVLV